MKKLLLILSLFTFAKTTFAQELDLMSQTAISENSPSQQLIGYAMEVSSVALENKKKVGRYSCDKIYSMNGYDALPSYPCELIMHSEKGPIVVRYKDILPSTDEEIHTFLKENQMDESLYYNNGRFRFSLNDEDLNSSGNVAEKAREEIRNEISSKEKKKATPPKKQKETNKKSTQKAKKKKK